MSEQRKSTFEQLSSSVIHLIFDYLSPVDIHLAFCQLNRRLTKILHRYRFTMPSSDEMSFELYQYYLRKILPRYASQFEHICLSERSSAHAISWFLTHVSLNKIHWPKLKCLTIDDIPEHLLHQLTNESTLIENIETLSLNIDETSFHFDEFQDFSYSDIFFSVLNKCRKLRNVNFNFGPLRNDVDLRRMNVHRSLQKLRMTSYSTDFIVELLSSGCLQVLEEFDVTLFTLDHDIHLEPETPPSIEPADVPRLRCVTIRKFVNLSWILTLFEELQRQSQLKQMKIKGICRLNLFTNFPRASAFNRWLLLNQSEDHRFQLELAVSSVLEAGDLCDEILIDYRRLFGEKSVPSTSSLFINYPTTKFPDEIPQKSLWSNEQKVEPMMKTLEIYREDDSDEYECISWWPLLTKIVLYGEYCTEKLVNRFSPREFPEENSPFLIEILQRAPNFRHLKVNCDWEYATELTSNADLCRLLVGQLETLEIEAHFDIFSFDDLVQIVLQFFSHSSRPARLKHLILKTSEQPKYWFTMKQLLHYTRQLLDYFPSLIHFKLCHQFPSQFQTMLVTMNDFHRQQHIYSVLPDRCVNRWINYRCKSHSLEIWL